MTNREEGGSRMYEAKRFGPDVTICAGAVVVGDVELGAGVSVWYNAVVRGDEGAIRIGAGSNIQECVIIHEKTTVGCGCTVGHGSILHGCTLGDRVLVGMGSTVLNGAEIGDDCLVGAGSLVTGKMKAPAGSLILGSPARVIRPLTAEETAGLKEDAQWYSAAAAHYRRDMAAPPAPRPQSP